MKNIAFCIIFLLLIPGLIFARPREFVREYTYIASEQDSRVTARANASDQMRALLLQEIGQVVIAEQRRHTESRHNEFIYDNFSERITAIAAGMVKMEILNETWDGHRFFMRAKIVVDPSEISQRANETLLNMREVKALEEQNRQIMQQVENLNRQNVAQQARAQRNENFLFAEINEYRMQIAQLRRENTELRTRNNSELAKKDSIISSLNLQLSQLMQELSKVEEQAPVIVERVVEREVRVQVAAKNNDEITITTNPSGAMLFVNGRYIGRTPYAYKNAPHGRIEIRVRLSGFEAHTWNLNYFGGRTSLNKNFQ